MARVTVEDCIDKVPNRFEGNDGEERIVYNAGSLRYYRKEKNSWWYNSMTRLGSASATSSSASLPIAVGSKSSNFCLIFAAFDDGKLSRRWRSGCAFPSS